MDNVSEMEEVMEVIRKMILNPSSSSSSLPDSLAPKNPPPQFQTDPDCGTIFTQDNPNRRNRPTLEFSFFDNLFRSLSNYTSFSNEERSMWEERGVRFRTQAQTSTNGFLDWTFIFRKYMSYSSVLNWARSLVIFLSTASNSNNYNIFDWKRLLSLALSVLNHRVSRFNDAPHQFIAEKWRQIVSAIESWAMSAEPEESDKNPIYPHDEL